MGRPHSLQVKEQARRLRATGASYSTIRKQLGVPSSTLSTWLGENPEKKYSRKEWLDHLKNIRVLAARAKQRIRLEEEVSLEAQAEKSIESLSLEDSTLLKSMLSILYWAEGAKHKGVSGLKFVNTDPRLAHLYITLLRRSFAIDETKLRIRLHLHWYHNEDESIHFWSTLLSVPKSQFGKVYRKKRVNNGKRFRKNFMGICFITYLDSSVRKEILQLGFALQRVLCQ